MAFRTLGNGCRSIPIRTTAWSLKQWSHKLWLHCFGRAPRLRRAGFVGDAPLGGQRGCKKISRVGERGFTELWRHRLRWQLSSFPFGFSTSSGASGSPLPPANSSRGGGLRHIVGQYSYQICSILPLAARSAILASDLAAARTSAQWYRTEKVSILQSLHRT